ncbi:hypothetical protein Acor_27630 [Acrocarpospora corrugata]|uniref:Uncharacterized protein n=1 Tax=Acrocarpospora corrugata TaxID=35763 RepID=A0A5M3VX04_9ACTN|nr:hypothetical protein [Acrocarpospora corrugata]GES00699.1 hypothetical protein Acor_27630 [Acrocarpospora corrugata]
MSDTYRIVASRDEDWWGLVISGPALKRPHHTQVKRLEQAEEMARDLVTLMLDVEEADLTATFEVTLSDEDVVTELREALEARQQAELARAKAASRTHSTVADLNRRGYVQRDIGFLLGISHQAVGKLLNEPTKNPAEDTKAAKSRTRRRARQKLTDA